MKEIYQKINNLFITDPSRNYFTNIYKHIPILDHKSHRLIRLMILKKIPLVKVDCRICRQPIKFYFKHIEICIGIEHNIYERLQQLRILLTTDWYYIRNLSTLINLSIEIF